MQSDKNDLDIPQFLRRSQKANAIAQRVLNGGKDPETISLEEHNAMRVADTSAASTAQKTDPIDPKPAKPELPTEVEYEDADGYVTKFDLAASSLIDLAKAEANIKAKLANQLELTLQLKAIRAQIKKLVS